MRRSLWLLLQEKYNLCDGKIQKSEPLPKQSYLACLFVVLKIVLNVCAPLLRWLCRVLVVCHDRKARQLTHDMKQLVLFEGFRSSSHAKRSRMRPKTKIKNEASTYFGQCLGLSAGWWHACLSQKCSIEKLKQMLLLRPLERQTKINVFLQWSRKVIRTLVFCVICQFLLIRLLLWLNEKLVHTWAVNTASNSPDIPSRLHQAALHFLPSLIRAKCKMILNFVGICEARKSLSWGSIWTKISSVSPLHPRSLYLWPPKIWDQWAFCQLHLKSLKELFLSRHDHFWKNVVTITLTDVPLWVIL